MMKNHQKTETQSQVNGRLSWACLNLAQVSRSWTPQDDQITTDQWSVWVQFFKTGFKLITGLWWFGPSKVSDALKSPQTSDQFEASFAKLAWNWSLVCGDFRCLRLSDDPNHRRAVISFRPVLQKRTETDHCSAVLWGIWGRSDDQPSILP